MQQIIIFEGADVTGKSEIAKALSKDLNIPYFKNQREQDGYKVFSEEYNFKTSLEYDAQYILSFLKQTGHSVILDRHYPSEFVYSRVFCRDSNMNLIWKLDEEFAKLNTLIVYCYKPLNQNYFQEYKHKEKLVEWQNVEYIQKEYEKFLMQTKCTYVEIDTSSKDLRDQIRKINNMYRWNTNL